MLCPGRGWSLAHATLTTPVPRLPDPHPPPVRAWPAATRPFPPGLGCDTIPIARRPAVQFNPFYPAGSSPVTGGFFRSGPAG